MGEDNIEALAADLKRLVRTTDLTYRSLAKMFGVSVAAISGWLNGRSLVRLSALQGIVELAGGDVENWTARWTRLKLGSTDTPAPAPPDDDLEKFIARLRGLRRDLPPGATIEVSIKVQLPSHLSSTR